MSQRKPRVLLISPGIIKWTDADFGLPHLVSLGGYLAQRLDVEPVLVDLAYENCDQHQLLRTLEALGPFVLIGVSCYSSFDFLRVRSLGRFLAASFPGVPLVTGGYHASARSEELIGGGAPFAAVVRGEGERGLAALVERTLGGDPPRGDPAADVVDAGIIEDLDDLPPYRWDLLDRYWPRALEIGRKLQVYLSRGCPYHCTFCMERAKFSSEGATGGGYRWRAYSPERALDELRRLAKRTELSAWVVNLADPLFGFTRAWRREVLEGIVREGLLPRQYWTLTRCEDLDQEDVALLARARFSIGVGVESGDPRMLRVMNKTRHPERYIDALRRLARLSREHRLNWAGNIIVGHPGETLASMEQTHELMSELFAEAGETCGWLSVDPFRLYPGSDVAERLDHYTKTYGTRFYHPRWWHSWYDGSLRAEHLDPSDTLSFADRVRFVYERYPPLIGQILSRFRGQGRSVDQVYQRSIREQRDQLTDGARDRLLRGGEAAARSAETAAANTAAGRADKTPAAPALPIGLQVRDPWVRRREEAVRRLLGRGLLPREPLIEALLTVPPERYLGEQEAQAMLAEQPPRPAQEGEPPAWVGISAYALGLAALDPGPGERFADGLATRGYLAALLARLVGAEGQVLALCPGSWRERRKLGQALDDLPQVSVVAGRPTHPPKASADDQGLDGLWLGAALPRVPAALCAALREDSGRLVTVVGPRFGQQDLVCVTRRREQTDERIVARLRVPVVAGDHGWIPRPRSLQR